MVKERILIGKLVLPFIAAAIFAGSAACTTGGRVDTSPPPASTGTVSVPTPPSRAPETTSVNTQPGGPSVTTGKAINITDSSATLRGTFDNLGNAQAVNISFQWGTAPGTYAHETPTATMGTTAPFQANISELSLGTKYYFRAKAVGAGTVYGSEANFTAGQPGAPADLAAVTTGSATKVSSDSALLIGSLDSLGTQTAMNVTFQWGTVAGSYTGETNATTMGTPGAFQVDLTGLRPSTTYYFRARGMNGTASVNGTEVSFTTQ